MISLFHPFSNPDYSHPFHQEGVEALLNYNTLSSIFQRIIFDVDVT